MDATARIRHCGKGAGPATLYAVAGNRLRKLPGGISQLALRSAKTQGQYPLILGNSLEDLGKINVRLGRHRHRNLVPNGSEDEARTKIDIALGPVLDHNRCEKREGRNHHSRGQETEEHIARKRISDWPVDTVASHPAVTTLFQFDLHRVCSIFHARAARTSRPS